ncbi:MAG: hypothetical protein LBO68_02490, partial [Synergistaceae bacterium]|nr:hypothetical protein [Synergistaceae bacterium]
KTPEQEGALSSSDLINRFFVCSQKHSNPIFQLVKGVMQDWRQKSSSFSECPKMIFDAYEN